MRLTMPLAESSAPRRMSPVFQSYLSGPYQMPP